MKQIFEQERHADVADQARQTTENLVAIEEKARRQAVQGQGRESCVECDDEIPQARRAAYPAAVRCAPCQDSYERGRRPR